MFDSYVLFFFKKIITWNQSRTTRCLVKKKKESLSLRNQVTVFKIQMHVNYFICLSCVCERKGVSLQVLGWFVHYWKSNIIRARNYWVFFSRNKQKARKFTGIRTWLLMWSNSTKLKGLLRRCDHLLPSKFISWRTQSFSTMLFMTYIYDLERQNMLINITVLL